MNRNWKYLGRNVPGIAETGWRERDMGTCAGELNARIGPESTAISGLQQS